ncbi:zinc finger protein OZF-like [Phlebotomus argentipes]|uniref:zinc finger protein OZF-like n=1 Tax=Phlebotomus argentipes TaxID=94469 RepID=UPI002892D222|nr:zinc finger protein OZF-like [Phlebotomus argentipes]
MSISLDFSKICRVCCLEGSMMSVFKVHISKKLMACAAIQVWPNDGLPDQICTKCVAKLHIAFQFKKLCEKSDARLRQQAASAPVEAPESVENPPSDYVYVDCQAIEATSGQYENLQTSTYSTSLLPTYSGQGIFQAYTVPAVEIQPSVVTLSTVAPPVESAPQEEKKYVSEDKQECTEKAKLKTDQESSRQCHICGKELVSAAKLSRHMKIHSGEQPYKCKFCLKRFSHSGNFKVHLRMHTNERPYQCTMCNRACRQLQDLEKHIRTHTGEKPHQCSVCSKKFSTSSNLIAHVRIHSGEKPYVCSICGKAFCQSNELTKHTRIHTGEKPHQCSVCHRRFNGSSTLTIHMRSHTGEKPYVCTVCSKAYSQSRCLQMHLKTHTVYEAPPDKPPDKAESF